MSWVSENKFLTGFGVVMLAGLGTLGYFTLAAMSKSEAASGEFAAASSQFKKLLETKPSLTKPHLEELLAQKQEMTAKIEKFQKELKSRVLPTAAITPVEFQDRLKKTVAQVITNAAAANVERPKDFYMGFNEYQNKTPDEKAAPALARELSARELVMNVLIKTGSIELEEFRPPSPDDARSKNEGSGRRRNTNAADHGMIDRSGLHLKFTSNDEALRKVLTDLANHPQQLFIIRNVVVRNKQTDSPPRLAAPASPPAPSTPSPATPARASSESLAYIFGTEKITSIVELEILNIEEPKPKSDKPDKPDKPEKSGKKKGK